MARRYSLHGSTVGWRPAWPEMAVIAAQAGYDGVVMPRDTGGDPAAHRDALAQLGIAITAMPVPAEVRRDEAAFEASLRDLEPRARSASALGCKLAVVGLPPSSDSPKADQRAVYLRRLRVCTAVLSQYGIRLALEAISPLHLRRAKPYEFIWRMDEMLDLARECAQDAGIVADCWHWHHAGETEEDILALGSDAILDVHISDAPDIPADEIRDLERLLPGEGVIDLPGFFAALDRTGYEGAVSLEVFGSRLASLPPLEAAKAALEAARRFEVTRTPNPQGRSSHSRA